MFPTRTHNVVDYLWGFAAFFAPYIFGFDGIYPARDSFVFLGALVILYSLMSDYWYSPAKLLPLNFHMILDLLCAALLICAPLLFDYQGALTMFQYVIHLAFGAALIVNVVCAAQNESEAESRRRARLFNGDTPRPRVGHYRILKGKSPTWRHVTLKH